MAADYLEVACLPWKRVGLPPHPCYPSGVVKRDGRRAEGKEPFCDGYQERTPADQWDEALAYADFWNLGVLPGRDHMMLEGDTPQSCTHLRAGLAGIGVYSELTWRDLSHFWIRVRGVPSDFGDFKHLAPEIGAGEARTNRSNCIVSTSMIDGKRYRPETGTPEDIGRLRVVDFKDIAWAVSSGPGTREHVSTMPLRIPKRDVPGDATEILRNLHGWPEKTPYRRILANNEVRIYGSASEAEAAAVAIMALAGLEYKQIAAQFETHEPGSYWRNGRQRGNYLWHTWRAVVSELASSTTRQEIAGVYHAVEYMAFPGRGGLLDQAVLLGLLAECWRCDRWIVYMSDRDLAEYAAASHKGTQNALQRLRDAGIVRRMGFVNGTSSWDVAPARAKVAIGHTPGEDSGSRDVETGKAPVVCMLDVATVGAQLPAVSSAQEVWSQSMLGRSAGAVYRLLGDRPANVDDLAASCGKSKWTVKRALQRLFSEGLADQEAGGWIRGRVMTLKAYVEVKDVHVLALRRRAQHERERLAWEDTKARQKS